MRNTVSSRHIFVFKSGTRIEVFWDMGQECWGAILDKRSLGFRHIVGHGRSKLQAVKELRIKFAAAIQQMIQEGINL